MVTNEQQTNEQPGEPSASPLVEQRTELTFAIFWPSSSSHNGKVFQISILLVWPTRLISIESWPDYWSEIRSEYSWAYSCNIVSCTSDWWSNILDTNQQCCWLNIWNIFGRAFLLVEEYYWRQSTISIFLLVIKIFAILLVEPTDWWRARHRFPSGFSLSPPASKCGALVKKKYFVDIILLSGEKIIFRSGFSHHSPQRLQLLVQKEYFINGWILCFFLVKNNILCRFRSFFGKK